MKFTNSNIYQLANALTTLANDNKIYIPVKANFFMQKNINVLTKAAQEIDEARMIIAKQYGVMDNETQSYQIPKENIATVNKELNDLLNIEQELDIKKIKLEDLGSAEFTATQMQALMIMIEEE